MSPATKRANVKLSKELSDKQTARLRKALRSFVSHLGNQTIEELSQKDLRQVLDIVQSLQRSTWGWNNQDGTGVMKHIHFGMPLIEDGVATFPITFGKKGEQHTVPFKASAKASNVFFKLAAKDACRRNVILARLAKRRNSLVNLKLKKYDALPLIQRLLISKQEFVYNITNLYIC